MSERERALEAARRILNAPRHRLDDDAREVAQILLASSPPPSCEVWRDLIERAHHLAICVFKGTTKADGERNRHNAAVLSNAINHAKQNERNGAALDAASPPCEMRKALEHIREYWNGTRTDAAMWDALNHIVETARAALDASRTEEKAADTCEHDWSEWEPILGGRGYHVERKCSKCGKEQYDD